MRRDRALLRETFSHTATPAPPTSRREKNFAPNAFVDAFTGLTRRKTRESVRQLIRNGGGFADRAAARAADFGSASTCEERAARSRARADGGDTALGSDADFLPEQVVDRLLGLAARRLHHLADEFNRDWPQFAVGGQGTGRP